MSFHFLEAPGNREERQETGGKNRRIERKLESCPTYDWWRYDPGEKTTYSGPHDNMSTEYAEVQKILMGETAGLRWQPILCRETLGDYSKDIARDMLSGQETENVKVFLASTPNRDPDCKFISAIMVCVWGKKTNINLLCSGVTGVGGSLLEYAIEQMKKDENVTIVLLEPSCERSVEFYKRHFFRRTEYGYMQRRIRGCPEVGEQLVWGLDDEREEWKIRNDEELLGEMNRRNKPKLTYWGTRLLAFIHKNEKSDDESVFSDGFIAYSNAEPFDHGAYLFALNKIDQNTDVSYPKTAEDTTLRTIGDVLSERGVEEFKSWLNGNAFESDMQIYGTFIQENVMDGQDAGLEWLVKEGFARTDVSSE